MISDFNDFEWQDELSSDDWENIEQEFNELNEFRFIKSIKITAKTLDTIRSLIDTMMMNGAILVDGDLDFTSENVVMTFKMLKKGNPICVN